MKLSRICVGLGICALVLIPLTAAAHCQIPCGIYDDSLRFVMLNEHITTIEKSMKEITELSAAADKNYNQIVRWVTNKDDHADKFMEVVSDYFLTQRIKPVDPSDGAAHADYLKKIEMLHQMLVYAMKCKQTTDLSNPEKLKQLAADFKTAYFAETGTEHK
jgi:nickel superoxide dismutase